MTTRAHGKQLGEFVGVKAPPSLSVQLLQEAEFGVTRITWDERDCGVAARIAREKAHLVCLQRRDIPTNPYWVEGRPVPMSPVKRGQFTLLNLDSEHASYLSEPIDCMAMYLPQEAFDRFTQEQGVPKIGSMHTPLGVPVDDVVVRSLGESLLPALNNPNQSSRLFVEYVALALLAHLASTYGGMRPQARLQRGALAPWQERRAKELLIENIDGDIALAELAAACGLSRSHFARAFKATMGVPPHRWLLSERVKRGQELLLNSTLTLDQIASRCGFADQSHFTRVFSKFVRTTPGDWRRMYSSEAPGERVLWVGTITGRSGAIQSRICRAADAMLAQSQVARCRRRSANALVPRTASIGYKRKINCVTDLGLWILPSFY